MPRGHDPRDRAHRDASPRRSRWTRSSASCATTPPGSTAAAGTTSSRPSRSFRARPEAHLPGPRARSRWTRRFLRAYVQLLIKTCHRRGVHAMGGMAAQIPIKDDPAANEAALAKVRADKVREVTDGHDGTWVAHPGLVPIAKAIFDQHMKTPNQIHRKREDVHVTAARPAARCRRAPRTEAGLRHNIRVSVQYLEAWLRGSGLRAALQPHGGRGDGRDLPLARLAVDPPRRDARRREGRSPSSASAPCSRRRWTASASRSASSASRPAASRTPARSSSG